MPSGNGLEAHLKGRLREGRKLLVPYLTCGLPTPAGFVEVFRSLAQWADAIEVGIPFSDPVMDGPIIQASSMRALAGGITLDVCFELIHEARRRAQVPAVVMTYFNPVHRRGVRDFTAWLSKADVGGLVVPDLPYEEAGELAAHLSAAGIAHIQMVAPSTSEERAAMLASASRGFVYAVSRLGVTGAQESLASAAADVVSRVRPHTDVPVLLGIGIGTPAQAQQASQIADGVIVGTAVVARVLEDDPVGAATLVRQMRDAVDEVRGQVAR